MEEILREIDALPVAPGSRRSKLSDLLENYLRGVAETGKCKIEWSRVKLLLRRKMEIVMDEYHQERPLDLSVLPPHLVSEAIPFDEHRRQLLELFDRLNGIPFTISRFCELLCFPYTWYTRIDKYFRALEKVLNIVTCVNAEGNRAYSTKQQHRLPPQISAISPVNDTTLTNVSAMNEAFREPSCNSSLLFVPSASMESRDSVLMDLSPATSNIVSRLNPANVEAIKMEENGGDSNMSMSFEEVECFEASPTPPIGPVMPENVKLEREAIQGGESVVQQCDETDAKVDVVSSSEAAADELTFQNPSSFVIHSTGAILKRKSLNVDEIMEADSTSSDDAAIKRSRPEDEDGTGEEIDFTTI